MTRSFRCLSLLFLLCQGLSNCGFFDDPTTSSVSCDPNCSSTVTEKTVTLEGKLAQSYVKHAQVWADKLVGGEGDLLTCPGTNSLAPGFNLFGSFLIYLVISISPAGLRGRS